VFSPNQLTASVGDVVEFWFYPQNHSVARSDYKSPCIPYEDTGVGRQGFWSGFHPVAVVLSDVSCSFTSPRHIPLTSAIASEVPGNDQ
jgi:hypothetical protein